MQIKDILKRGIDSGLITVGDQQDYISRLYEEVMHSGNPPEARQLLVRIVATLQDVIDNPDVQNKVMRFRD